MDVNPGATPEPVTSAQAAARDERLREWASIPVIVISARGREEDKIKALDAGADDYVTKPFGMDELFARLRAALRRVAPSEAAAVVTTPTPESR